MPSHEDVLKTPSLGAAHNHAHSKLVNVSDWGCQDIGFLEEDQPQWRGDPCHGCGVQHEVEMHKPTTFRAKATPVIAVHGVMMTVICEPVMSTGTLSFCEDTTVC